MGYSDETWYVGSGRNRYYPYHVVYCQQMYISFAYLFWLANNKNKGKYVEFYLGYSDETWYNNNDNDNNTALIVCHLSRQAYSEVQNMKHIP